LSCNFEVNKQIKLNHYYRRYIQIYLYEHLHEKDLNISIQLVELVNLEGQESGYHDAPWRYKQAPSQHQQLTDLSTAARHGRIVGTRSKRPWQYDGHK